jgi:hypothetical protein
MTDSPVARSQPELAIYDRDTHAGTSAGGYPDFIQGADGVIRPPSRFQPQKLSLGAKKDSLWISPIEHISGAQV